MMKEFYEFGLELINIASKAILKNLKKVIKISYKTSAFNLVTNADIEVENLIIKNITSKFPTHSIIAEESGTHKKNSDFKWFIDPIDGTTNFAHNYPCFCVSIGFAYKDKLEFGFVKNPVTSELYSAKRNQGAKLNGKTIKVSKIKKLKDSLLVTGFPYDKTARKLSNFKNFERLTLLSHGVRRDGAAALDLCYVASGKLDGFWELKLSPWDVASGVLILEEAGGKVTAFHGKKFDLYGKEIVATNGLIHDEIIKYLK